MARIVLDARELRAPGEGQRLRALLHRLPRLAPQHVFVALVTPTDEVGFGRSIAGVEALAIAARPGSLRERIELPLALRRVGADLLHAVPEVACAAGRFAFVAESGGFDPLNRRRHLRLLRLIIAGHGLLLVGSHALAARLAHELKIPVERFRVVPPSINLPEIEIGEAAELAGEAFLRRVGLATPFALAFGEDGRGLDPDLQVVVAALDPLRELSLAILFRAKPPPVLEAWLETTGAVRQRVRIIGDVSERELAMVVRRAAAVVATRDSSAWPEAVLLGLGSGAAVVAWRVGGLLELVGEAGVLVPAGEVDPLCSSLYNAGLASGAGERVQLAARARARAEQFSWERGARDVLAAYEAMLGGKT